ncbi:MAG: ATP-binding cassette domain-containing protein [Dehalococcoidales bacterium]
MTESIISVDNLVKKFDDLVAVDHINFQVTRGELFGFLGPNGAGKTTTINILCTLARPTSGSATVNGFDVVRQQAQVRQSIGLVFQDPSLDERLSGVQNLRFHAMVYNVPGSVREKRIEEVLRITQLWDKRHHDVRTYSGGMKRRLELARGLLHYPKVLFLDEPTIGLDPQTRNRLWEYIMEMKRREGTTIFLTTHYMDEADKAERIAVMDHGKIVAMDSPERLKRGVGKDTVTLKTDDNARAAEEIRTCYHIEPRQDNDELVFPVENGEKFLPSFIREFSTRIVSVSLRNPSLDDVFLQLTGREMREEEVSNSFKAMIRQHGRRMRR